VSFWCPEFYSASANNFHLPIPRRITRLWGQGVLHTKRQAECPSLSVPFAPNYSHPSIRLATKTQLGIHPPRVPFLILSLLLVLAVETQTAVYVCLSPATPCNFTEYSSAAWLGAERDFFIAICLGVMGTGKLSAAR
jgi:hypothetical protein